MREHLPAEGLFAEKTWRIAPRPFELGPAHVELIGKLGLVLHRFNVACNLLYRQSAEGKAHGWVAPLLDAGKPPELVALARDEAVKGEVPAVIRPDLILTEEGFALSEIDSVPGGIGLTAWLGETYAALGETVLGGADGHAARLSPRCSGTATSSSPRRGATYRPEMAWLVGADRVKSVEDYTPDDRPAYRFFEAFDYPQLAKFREAWRPGARRLTAPLKPYLEEKLWLALFWSRPLQEFWRQEIGEKGQNAAPAAHPLLVGARSRAAAGPRRHPRAQHPVVVGAGRLQPEAARAGAEDLRLLAPGLGRAGRPCRLGHAVRGMGGNRCGSG